MKLNLSFVLALLIVFSSIAGYSQIEGCMNPYACNYDSTATVDNGTCIESLVYKALSSQNVSGFGNIKFDDFGNYFLVVNINDTVDISGFVPPSGFYTDLGLQGNVYNQQVLLLKFNASSQLVWSFPIYSNGYDGCWSLEIDGMNNLYLSGYCGSNVIFGTTTYLIDNQFPNNGFLAKVNSNGDSQWVKFMESTSQGGLGNSNLDVTDNGDCILTSYVNSNFIIETQTYSFSPGFVSYWSNDGQLTYIGASSSYFSPVCISNSGSSYVSGYGSIFMQGIGQASDLTKYDNGHNVVWQNFYYANDGTQPITYNFVVDNSDELYVLFNSNTDTLFIQTADELLHLVNPNFIWDPITGVNNNLSSFFLVKFAPDGSVVWTRSFYGSGNFWANSIEINRNRGELAVVGDYTLGTDFNFDGEIISNPGYYNFHISKYDLDGNRLYLGTSNTLNTASSIFSSLDIYGQIHALIRVENSVQFEEVVIDNPDPSNIPVTGGQFAILTIGYSGVTGCTDTLACNYNPNAGCDDGSCVYPGCTDVSACNYEPSAGCENGACAYHLIEIAPPICLVTVDEISGHNMIVWEVPSINQIDQYLIFKETNVLNDYQQIGQLSVNDLGEFVDMNSNPQVQANRYKLAVIDSCGATSGMCDAHKTIHLSANFGIGGVINLLWTNYEGLSFSTYNIFRGNSVSGFSLIGSVPSNQLSFTDIAPSSAEYIYYVEVGGIACNPDRTVVSSKSNYLNTNPDAIEALDNQDLFMVYVISSNGNLRIKSDFSRIGNAFEIYNSVGSLVHAGRILSSDFHVDLFGLATGTYIFKSGQYVKKIDLIR